jgi:glycosyltransferase involved in cell wall biosynthesis
VGLAQALAGMAADPDRAAEMGARGRALYERRFAPSTAFAAWERILREAAA